MDFASTSIRQALLENKKIPTTFVDEQIGSLILGYHSPINHQRIWKVDVGGALIQRVR